MIIHKCSISFLILCVCFMTSTTVYAHVTVHPEKSYTNTYERYVVRVPVEKDSHTTKITLQVPKGVTFASVFPTDNWKYTFKKNKHDDITSVTWRAVDGGIKPQEFMEFAFMAANPAGAGKVKWKAIQTYADGTEVKWVGDQDAEHPASVTTIQNQSASDHENVNVTQNNQQKGDEGNQLPIGLAASALLLAIISLFRK